MQNNRTVVGIGALFALLGTPFAKAQTKSTLTPAMIDHAIRAEWKKEAILPAPPVDDARFLRRVYLDIVGAIPTPQAVTEFLADKSPDKRSKVVDVLLHSPRYTDRWTNYWDNVLMGRQVRFQGPLVDRAAFRQWLHAQFEQNTPWNKLVYNLVSATGQNSTGGSYAKAMGLMRPPGAPGAMMEETSSVSPGEAARVNGAVNWTLKYFPNNYQDLSGSASKVFLGVQIQCAQCHDHKTEKWKQDDFRKFTACFVSARPQFIDKSRMLRGIRRVDLEDMNVRRFAGRMLPRKENDMRQYVAATPSALDGTDFSDSPNRRQALAAWMTAPDNPWFAEAIVNRMWAHFMGRGFVEPINDFRPSNPANMPELLKQLAEDFKANDYDLKQLIRTICATQVYQLSSAPAKKTDPDNKLWARYRLKPMGPEQMLDSLVQATNLQPVLEKIAGGNLDALKFQMIRQFVFLFDVDEEFEQKDFEGTIPAALMLLNGNLVNRGVTPIPGTAQSDILAMSGSDAQKIEALYLRTVSRKPTAAELKKWIAFVNAPRDIIVDELPNQPALNGRGRQQAKGENKQIRRGNGPDPLARFGRNLTASNLTPKQQAYEDLFWALLNSSEFMFNH